MLGAIAGDIIGSRFEHAAFKTTRFSLFHPRCRFAREVCGTTAPELRQTAPGQFAACLAHDPASYPDPVPVELAGPVRPEETA